ncbi:hypothetical protein D6D18_06286 [Aureobasidium pullulans]|nr:hypothetical protein D6D18_06286 [Aureobasidium pullulans]
MSQASVRQPAVAGPDAMDPGPLVIEYTLEALNHEGYINAKVTDQIPTLENIAGDGASLRLWDRERLLATDPEGGEVGESQLGKGEPDHVHPTLQREQWIGIDERDWQAILPSIELASRFLDDPHITPFFHGLDNATELKDPLLKAAYGDLKFHRFDSDNGVVSTDAGFTNALFAMMSMRDQVQLRFADEGRGHASTSWKPGFQVADMSFHQDFLSILRQEAGYNPQRWSRSWAPGTHEPSARFRTRVLLATTIVHELAHCAWFIKCKGKKDLPEPYLRDRPVNELGWELENLIWTGIIEASGRGVHVSAPYGLHIERFPGRWFGDDPDRYLYIRGAPEDWGVTWATQYPVSMDWCRSLFTKEYWEKVSRYGFIQVRPRRLKGVRLQVTSYPRPEVGDDTMSPKSRTLLKYREDRRIKAMKAGVKADDIDSSDEEDVDAQSIVVRGKHKKELEEELRKQREEDGDTEMPDA